MSKLLLRRIAPALALLCLVAACGGKPVTHLGAPAVTEPATPTTVDQPATPGAKDVSTPVGSHRSSQPPPIVLISSGGARQSGTLGSYCWSGESSGVCADSVGTPVPRDPLALRASTPIRFDLAPLGNGIPSEVSCAVYRYDDVVRVDKGSGRPLIMPGLELPSASVPCALYPKPPLPPALTLAMLAGLAPGHYAIEVSASFSSGAASFGDTTQGFNVAVFP